MKVYNFFLMFVLKDDGSHGSAAVVPEMVSRSSSSHEVSASVSGSMIQSPEVEQSNAQVSIRDQQQQHQVPLGSVAIVS